MPLRNWTSLLLSVAVGGCASVHSENAERMQILAFADTSHVRIEVEVPNAAAFRDASVRAAISGVGARDALWSGDLGILSVDDQGVGRVVQTVDGLEARLWSPESPNLYHLRVSVAGTTVTDSVRFGFRRFESKDGRLLLNGKPVFLRGNAINPPERTIPDSLEASRPFVEGYIRFLKQSGVNIIRSTRASRVWFDVADELGMMYFQGNYGTPEGGRPTDPPDDLQAALKWYRDEVFEPLVNHPSIVIYVLSNEQASKDIGYLSRGADEVETFLDSVYAAMKEWDETRVYIGNAGYGLGRSGDVCDIHRYWGWYYNSFLSYYTLRSPDNYWRGEPGQPITLTENTGNYTGPSGRFNLVSRSKQPDSQLNWTGHAPDDEQPVRALAHQAFVAKQAIEIARRVRRINKHVSGIMPFTTPFFRWSEIERFADMGAKPVLEQYAVSYQPVLLSWELWTRQVYAGSTLRPTAHVVNDSDSKAALRDLELYFELMSWDGTAVAAGRVPMGDVPYYGSTRRGVEVPLSANLATGTYTLEGELREGGEVVSVNKTNIFVAVPDFARATGLEPREVVVFDRTGRIGAALKELGIASTNSRSLDFLDPQRHLLLTAGGSLDELEEAEAARRFIASGGRILNLEPDTSDVSWLPAGVQLQTAPLDHALVYPGGRPFRNALAANPERPNHPVLAGIDRDRLYMWSDHTGWNETRPGFPEVYPVTRGFVLTDRDDLARTAVLANYDHGLEGVALAEMFEGKGSVLVSGFGILDRAGLDPVADRLLMNMVRYQASEEEHHPHPLVTSPIIWGEYGSEHGLVTGIYSGLLVNTVPVIPAGLRERYPYRVDDEGFHYAGSFGGWNTRPSIEYVARGRRPFGPYGFTLGGSVKLPDGHAEEGEGRFWLRIPEHQTAMVTTVENPASAALELEIDVNGIKQRHPVPPGQQVDVTTTLRKSESTLAVTYRGDRRLVLHQTDFR